MRRPYSRLTRTEEKRNLKKAYTYIALTILSFALLLLLGIPAIVKMSAFLSELRGSSEPITKDDTTPPPPPQIDVLPEGTNKQNLEIKGSTEPKVTVIIIHNGDVSETLSGDNGQFSHTITLKEGENVINAYSKDASGNEGQVSNEQTVVYDNDAPELTVSTPSDGQEYFGARQRQITIEGKTEENTSILINDRFVAVEDDGSFAYTTTLNEGENNFVVKATDNAGNIAEKAIKVTFSP